MSGKYALNNERLMFVSLLSFLLALWVQRRQSGERKGKTRGGKGRGEKFMSHLSQHLPLIHIYNLTCVWEVRGQKCMLMSKPFVVFCIYGVDVSVQLA